MRLISPTPGRVVWYHPNEHDPNSKTDQPLAALVAYVHGDRMVNLMVISPTGSTYPRTSVPLVQEGDAAPEAGARYCEWMPYQKGQAAKTEALEATANKSSSALLPHQERVVVEANDLREKITKLTAFIVGESFRTLNSEEQRLLESQRDIMNCYLDTLGARVARF